MIKWKKRTVLQDKWCLWKKVKCKDNNWSDFDIRNQSRRNFINDVSSNEYI